jgi:hypothetical protein
MNGSFQYAYDTQLNGFAWIMQPENSPLLRNFNIWMTGTHATHWLDWFPVEEEVIKGLKQDEKAVTMVDVGGSLGHELLELKKRYSEIPGRLILQDLLETIMRPKCLSPSCMTSSLHNPLRVSVFSYYLVTHSVLPSNILIYRRSCILPSSGLA